MALYKRYKLNDRSIRPEWDKIAGHEFSAFNDEIKQGRINLVPTACICGSKADKIIGFSEVQSETEHPSALCHTFEVFLGVRDDVPLLYILPNRRLGKWDQIIYAC